MTRTSIEIRLAVWVVVRFAANGDTIAGDLIEERRGGRSVAWVWWQVAGALVATVWPAPPLEIRPLTLVEAQPDDAFVRSNLLLRRRMEIDLTANPAGHVGGLGIVILAALTAVKAPFMLWFLLAAIATGAVLGLLRIRRGRGLPDTRAIMALRG